MRGQTKTGNTVLEYIKGLKAVLLDYDPNRVTDIDEIDNWENFHGENQEEIDDMAKIKKAEASLGLAKQKMAKAKQSLEKQRENPHARPTNMKFKKVENSDLENQTIR